MRAALHHAPRRSVIAGVRMVAGLRRLVRYGIVRARRPFPDVADHVEQAVAVGRKRVNRRGALVSVLVQVLVREVALPGIGQKPSFGIGGIAPWIGLAFKTAAGGELPFRFGRQLLAAPRRIGERVLMGDMHDRMIIAAGDRAVRSFWMPPVRAGLVLPPGEI